MQSKDQFSFTTEPFSVANSNGADDEVMTIERAINLVEKIFKDRHGFFTPYKSVPDFLETLSAPVGVPVVLGVASALFLATSAISGITTFGAFCVAVAAALFDEDDLLISSLSVLGLAAITNGITLLVGSALALATVLSIPFTLTELVTRTAASIFCPIINPIIDGCSSDNTDVPEEYSSYSYS
ncbi:hypothetical protein [uncultured Legionella sp.]|uniref:hypothetical protein n=1 Tax=uncultured Legionella sp. TaxID=210934 RepID=UPI00263646A5|nr:hypothetical protein [uncultured Legionella sp.]